MTAPRFRLNLQDHRVSWVDSDSYPPAGGCHLICLSDRQCATIRDLVYPVATWPTRFAHRLHGDVFEPGDEAIRQEHLTEIHDLLYQIGEGSSVSCTELVAALTDLAAAVAAGAGGSGEQTIVNCGGGGSTTTLQNLADCLGQYPVESMLPAEEYEEPDPEGEPPEGFDTWEEYHLYKCKAAHWVLDQLIGTLRNFGLMNVVASTLSLVTFSVAGALAAFAAVLAPPAFLAIVGVLIQLELVAAGANSLLNQVADYLAARKSTIVCAMYNSSSAADLVAVMSSLMDDAIESIEYGTVFAGLGATIAPLLTSLTTQLVDRKIFQTLWSVSADVVYPSADCDPCDPYFGYLAALSFDEPYNVLVVGDSVTAGGSSAENGYQVVNPTPARVYFTTEGATTTLGFYDEYYHAQTGWTVVGAQIYRASDDADMGSFTVPDSNGSWQTIEDSAEIALEAATQYYVRLSPSGGNSTWHRRLSLVSLA
jgi:hypothetical protein